MFDSRQSYCSLDLQAFPSSVFRSSQTRLMESKQTQWLVCLTPKPSEVSCPVLPGCLSFFRIDLKVRTELLFRFESGGERTDDLDEALALAPDGFVAVVPDETEAPGREAMSDFLESLRLVLKRGELSSLALLFRDGLSIEIARSDRYRFWRRISPLLTEQFDND